MAGGLDQPPQSRMGEDTDNREKRGVGDVRGNNIGGGVGVVINMG